MENDQTKEYVLISVGKLEKLLRNNFLLSKGLLAFEYLCSHSDRPMFLRIKGVCEVLEITEEQLEACVLKQLIKPVVFQQQMMFSMYDVVFLSERLNRQGKYSGLCPKCRNLASGIHCNQTIQVHIIR